MAAGLALPPPALFRRPRRDVTRDESIELRAMNEDDAPTPSGPPDHVDGNRSAVSIPMRDSSEKPSALTRWWCQHIAPDVSHEQCRDFYALERTFLSYIRTANALASFGILIAQLFRLPTTADQSLVSRFFRLGRPVGAAAEALAIVVVAIGALRCWRQQRRILGGTVVGGGWELLVVTGGVLAFLIVLLTLNTGDAATGKPV